MIKKKIFARDLKIGDVLHGGAIVMSVRHSGIVNNKKVHLALKYPNKKENFLTTWGKYTTVTIYNT